MLLRFVSLRDAIASTHRKHCEVRSPLLTFFCIHFLAFADRRRWEVLLVELGLNHVTQGLHRVPHSQPPIQLLPPIRRNSVFIHTLENEVLMVILSNG